jgi:hypothetical protein
VSGARCIVASGVVALALASLSLLAGCETDPAPHVCPDVADGGLVITELRGDQNPDDLTGGQWIELYNATGVEQDLIGLHLRLRSLGGSTADKVIVRRSLVVPADGYVVIGLGPDAGRPDAIDYGVGNDAGADLSRTGAIDLQACDDEPGTEEYADILLYDVALPSTGTYSLGLSPPTATGNDTATNWCTNATAAGTPGEANPPCP